MLLITTLLAFDEVEFAELRDLGVHRKMPVARSLFVSVQDRGLGSR